MLWVLKVFWGTCFFPFAQAKACGEEDPEVENEDVDDEGVEEEIEGSEHEPHPEDQKVDHGVEDVEGCDSQECEKGDVVDSQECDDGFDGQILSEGEETLSLNGEKRVALEEEVPPTSPDSSEESEEGFVTPDPVGWNEAYFTSPIFGNSGPPRDELLEMCMGLMQYLQTTYPSLGKTFACEIQLKLWMFVVANGWCVFYSNELYKHSVIQCSLIPVRSDILIPYMEHCEWAYARFGIKASNWLSTMDYFEAWEARFKKLGNKVPGSCVLAFV